MNNWIPLEVSHKGCRHKLVKLVQESQQDCESGSRIEVFV